MFRYLDPASHTFPFHKTNHKRHQYILERLHAIDVQFFGYECFSLEGKQWKETIILVLNINLNVSINLYMSSVNSKISKGCPSKDVNCKL